MADGYISQIKLPNKETYDFRDRNLKVYTGACSTAAGTAIKDVTTDGAFTLAKGAVIFVNFSVTNSAAVGNLKLKINGEADANAKPIKYLVNGNDPANIPGAGYLRANQTYMFRYDGTNWVADLNYYTYSNDFASRIGHYNNILARQLIPAESLIVGDETGYEKVASGVTFNLAYPIVWCTAKVEAASSNYNAMFLQHYDRNIATGAKTGFTSAANKVIYLIVTINGNIATIDSNIITDTLPSSVDGKVYISLGKLGAQSTGANYFFLYPTHPMFEYKNGKIRIYEAQQNLSEIDDADDLKAIEAISGTTGLLKKTAANTWTLDTSNYVTSSGITSVTIGATSPVQSSTSTAQTGSSASTTISLKDAYGDTKNPYGAKVKNLVLAGPASGNNAEPSFRALVASDIPVTFTRAQLINTEQMSFVNWLPRYGSNAAIPAKTMALFADGLAIKSPATANDAAWLRFVGTGEADSVLEIATSDDANNANAEKIVARQYNGSSAIYEATLLGKIGDVYGATSFPVQVTAPKFIGNLTGTADKATADADNNTISTTYLKRGGGQMTGPLTWKDNTALPESSSLSYVLGIDAFASGGTTKWSSIANLRTALGLSNALHFIGITSTELSNGSTTSTLTAKSTNSLSKTTDFVDGDVVMDGDQLREYVWSGSAWRLLGITTSTAYTQPTSTATNTWIAQVSQGTDGKITATTGSLNTSGTWSGTASKATTTANTTDSMYLVGVKSNATTTLLHDTAISIQKGKITIGTQESSTSPSSETSTDRIIITPYYHTGGPWKIASSDDNSNAFLKLLYGSSSLIKIKHDGTFMTSLKASITGNATSADSAKWLMNRGGSTVTISDGPWAHGQTGSGGTNAATVWHQRWKQSGLTYTPSGGSATTLTDSGDMVLWLAQSATSNALTVNMAIDGIIYAMGGFKGNLNGQASTVARATFGDSSNGEHNANNIKSNGMWYYTSNGPATTLGASTGDGAIYSQAYSTSWAGQIAQDYRDGALFVRGLNSGTWKNWYAIPKFTTTTGGLGSTTQPVYIDTNGELQACTAYSSASVNYAASAGSVDWANTGHPSTFPPTIGTTSTTAAAGDHTHTISLTQTGTSTVNLAANTVYTLTAGGSSVVFKTPADGNTDTKVNVTATAAAITKNYLLMTSTAPTSSATGHTALGSASLWVNAVDKGKFELVLGNATATTTAGGQFGQLALYSASTAGTYLKAADGTAWKTQTLQAKDGTIALTSDIPTNLNQLTNGPGYTTNTGTVTSVKLIQGAGITVSSSGTAITTTGERTISITGMNTTNGSTTQWLNQKGGWSTPTAANVGALASSTVVTNVAISANTVANDNYPIVFATSNTNTTAAKNEGLQKSGTKFFAHPSTGALYATKFCVDESVTLQYNDTDKSLEFIF